MKIFKELIKPSATSKRYEHACGVTQKQSPKLWLGLLPKETLIQHQYSDLPLHTHVCVCACIFVLVNGKVNEKLLLTNGL